MFAITRPALGSLALAVTITVSALRNPRYGSPLAKDESDAAAVIAKFKENDPGLAKVFDGSAGYVVFPTVAKGGLGIGGARGKGYVYQHGRLIGRPPSPS